MAHGFRIRKFTGDGNCRACGARIRWAETLNDKRMPVDYDAESEQASDHVFVTGEPHWATCPKGEEFRKRKGLPPTQTMPHDAVLVRKVLDQCADRIDAYWNKMGRHSSGPFWAAQKLRELSEDDVLQRIK